MAEQRCWWTKATKAVVTGGNRGIGLETVRLLAQNGLTVILTSRSEQAGQAAVDSLVKQHGFNNLHFHQLDVQNADSVSCFADWMERTFNELHILINNAAVLGTKIDWELWRSRGVSPNALLKDRSMTEGFIEDYSGAKECLETNYFGVKRITNAMLPLLRRALPCKPRIVNVSSSGGMLENLKNPRLREHLQDPKKLSEKTIDDFVDGYLKDIESEVDVETKGWPGRFRSYIVSKVSLNAYTRVLAGDEQNSELSVNCIHPGSFVRTDMTLQEGEIAASEAAANIVRLALLPPQDLPTGLFYHMKDPSSF